MPEWPAPNLQKLEEVFRIYSDDFEEHRRKGRNKSRRGSLDVLGLPLLAHLAIRFFSMWPGDVTELLQNPTALYRNLVDLTCTRSGKASDQEAPEHSYVFSGTELRTLLQQTAEAITVLGRESISFDELELRVQADDPNERARLMPQVDRFTEQHELADLMISYYFRGGLEHLGCEFSHKGFREYLFAERIVGILKEYAEQSEGMSLPERPANEFWRDFQPPDPRHWLCARPGRMVGLQWLTPEVIGHLNHLIHKEIETAIQRGSKDPVGQEGWERIRDALADLWDWWTEGVHPALSPSGRVGTLITASL